MTEEARRAESCWWWVIAPAVGGEDVLLATAMGDLDDRDWIIGDFRTSETKDWTWIQAALPPSLPTEVK